MKDLASSEFRRLHRKAAQLDRRLSLVDLTGKVEPGSQDMEKRTLRLRLGKTADGTPILSPPVRWQGGGAGEFKVHAVPKDGEQMTLRSPSGTIGNGSLACPATYDDDNKPPSKSKDDVVLEFGGKASITFGKDGLTAGFDGVTMKLTKAGPTFKGGKISHDGNNIGSDHKHRDVQQGGALSGPPTP